MKFDESTEILSEIADIQTGPFGSQLHKDDYVDMGTPIVTVEHLGRRKFTLQNLPCVSNKDAVRLSKYVMRYGDTIFSRVGSVDRCSFASSLNDGWLFSGRCLRIRPRNNVHPLYLYYYLNSDKIKKYIRNIAVGATMPSINTKLMGEIPCSLPSIEIQYKIGKFLSDIDDKIEQNEMINKNLEEQAQTIFKSWFVDFEPFGGEMPTDWRYYKLSEFLPVITGKKNANVSSDRGIYPFFSCSQDISWTNDYSFEGNAILVAGNGDFNVKFYNGKFEAYQRTYVLIPQNQAYAAWLYYAIQHSLSEITIAARGSVIKFITKGNLENFTIPAPIDIQNMSVINKFSSINETIALKRKENLYLAQLRDTLLPRLMSGEIDVSSIEV